MSTRKIPLINEPHQHNKKTTLLDTDRTHEAYGSRNSTISISEHINKNYHSILGKPTHHQCTYNTKPKSHICPIYSQPQKNLLWPNIYTNIKQNDLSYTHRLNEDINVNISAPTSKSPHVNQNFNCGKKLQTRWA